MNEDVSNPLLSIVIPTKNRQEYALAAVDSALRLSAKNGEVEVIIRDCSDNDSLRGLLKSRFSDDSRYRYIYDSSKPSMTKNWDLAFSKACGLYVFGIGDDDAVLFNTLDVVYYMLNHDIDCMRQPIVNYFWPGAFLKSHNCMKVVFPKKMDGKVWRLDIDTFYKSKIVSCGFGYTHELPNVYHAIIKNDILKEHRASCGVTFSGTSLDVYSSFAFTKYTKVMAVADFPFSIHGACRSSNTNRLNQKDKTLIRVHFDEFDDLKMPEFLPKIFSSDVSIAESMIVALKDTDREHDLKKMNLAYVYGRSAALNLTMARSLYNDYKKYQTAGAFKFGFFSSFRHFLLRRLRQIAISKCTSLAEIISPKLWGAFLEKFGGSKRVVCPDIKAACIEIEMALPQKILEPSDSASGFIKHSI